MYFSPIAAYRRITTGGRGAPPNQEATPSSCPWDGARDPTPGVPAPPRPPPPVGAVRGTKMSPIANEARRRLSAGAAGGAECYPLCCLRGRLLTELDWAPLVRTSLAGEADGICRKSKQESGEA